MLAPECVSLIKTFIFVVVWVTASTTAKKKLLITVELRKITLIQCNQMISMDENVRTEFGSSCNKIPGSLTGTLQHLQISFVYGPRQICIV